MVWVLRGPYGKTSPSGSPEAEPHTLNLWWKDATHTGSGRMPHILDLALHQFGVSGPTLGPSQSFGHQGLAGGGQFFNGPFLPSLPCPDRRHSAWLLEDTNGLASLA